MSNSTTTHRSSGGDTPRRADAGGPDESGGRKAARKLRSAVTELVMVVVGALIISALLRAFVGQMFVIPSGSMENTLQVNDRVVVSKVTDFKRGDIVVFEDPAHWLDNPPQECSTVGKFFEKVGVLPSTSTSHLVKRAIGLPGDRVVCCDAQDRITVNGHPLDEADYVLSEDGRPSKLDFDVTVPKDRIFVMGDHRDQSGDSRCHLNDVDNSGDPQGMSAFIPMSRVVGPVVAIGSPFDRWQTFSTPPTFEAVPAGAAAPDKPKITVDGSC